MDLSLTVFFSVDQLEAGAAKYWELFYQRNGNRFFNDRHYLEKEVPDLVKGPLTLLEVHTHLRGGLAAGMHDGCMYACHFRDLRSCLGIIDTQIDLQLMHHRQDVELATLYCHCWKQMHRRLRMPVISHRARSRSCALTPCTMQVECMLLWLT